MSEGDLPRKFRNRRADGSRERPQPSQQRPWWQRVFGQRGRRGTSPTPPLALTVLDAQTSGDFSPESHRSGPLRPRLGEPQTPLQDQPRSRQQRIEPFRVSGQPVTLPRQHRGSAPRPARGHAAPRSPQRRSKPLPTSTVAVVTLHPKSANRPSRLRPPLSAPSKTRRPQSPKMKAMVYAIRILILSVGIGVLAGTLLSVWDPASRLTASRSQQAVQSSPGVASPQMLALGAEIQPLKTAIQELAFKTPQLAPGVFLLDLNTGAYLDLNGSTLFSAASTIKLPVLIAFFQDVDQGKIRLDEMLTLSQSAIAKEAGDLQYQPVGTRIQALETAVRMITISDNTATNMLIERLGGKEALSARFKSWGLTATVLNNQLADIEGTNTTTAKEMVWLLSRINRGDLITMTSRDRIIDILRQTQSTGLLPSGLGPEAKIAHKTGTLGILLADVGMVDLPNGQRYAIAVLVKRPFQDDGAARLIQQISKAAYTYFSQPQPAPSPLGFVPAASVPSPAGSR